MAAVRCDVWHDTQHRLAILNQAGLRLCAAARLGIL